jgi:hypothetical protein
MLTIKLSNKNPCALQGFLSFKQNKDYPNPMNQLNNLFVYHATNLLSLC